MIKKLRYNKLVWIAGALGLAFVATFLLQEQPNYHKTSRLGYIVNTVFYSTTNSLALVTAFGGEVQFSLAMPFYRQENGLTCEVAALRTALTYQGDEVTEDELIEKLAFDTRDPMAPDGTWGDPENGFIGDINGSIFKRTGFGVYDKPILDLALEYKRARIIEEADLDKVLKEVLSGNPVIVWGLLSRRAPVSWLTKEGKLVSVRPGEHARVVMGFVGDPADPEKIILMDPIYGEIRMGKNKFIYEWGIMENRAVVVYKELPPDPEPTI